MNVEDRGSFGRLIEDSNETLSELTHIRLKKFNKMQHYADIYLPLNYSTCFGCPSRPSTGAHKTLVAASGTDHTIWGASLLKYDQIKTRLRKLAPQIV